MRRRPVLTFLLLSMAPLAGGVTIAGLAPPALAGIAAYASAATGSHRRPSICLVRNAGTRKVYRNFANALAAAAPDDTLEVQGHCTGTATISQPVTIDGQASRLGTPTLNGGGAGPVITANADVTVSGLTITGGSAVNGGGLTINQSATLTDDTITGNTASGNGGGLTITPTSNQSVTLTDDTITGNSAGGNGGGIYSAGLNLATANVIVSGNTAGGNGGGVYIAVPGNIPTDLGTVATFTGGSVSGNAAASGGGIYISRIELVVNIDGVTINGNKATGNGGGLDNESIDPAPTTMVNSAITGNSAGNDGGGVYDDSLSGQQMNVSTDTITGNTAGNTGANYYYTSNGGNPI